MLLKNVLRPAIVYAVASLVDQVFYKMIAEGVNATPLEYGPASTGAHAPPQNGPFRFVHKSIYINLSRKSGHWHLEYEGGGGTADFSIQKRTFSGSYSDGTAFTGDIGDGVALFNHWC